jgi:hypothetical protein
METTTMFLVITLAALVLLALLQAYRIRKGGKFSSNFAKLFGVILLASFAAIAAGSGMAEEARTPLFTLLGTFAGYFAGAKSGTAAEDGAPGQENVL